MAEPLVRMERISKAYGSVQALKDVTFTVAEREIVGLLGDNGAGKSTLIKILSGAVPATSGEIWFRGKRLEVRGTQDAIAAGIETIYQDSALVPQLSIARNLFLGREPLTGPAFLNRMDKATMNRVAGELLARVGITKKIPPTTPISSLSGGERQSVAIARASGAHPTELRNQVTSPGGTTAEALYQLEKGGFRTVVSKAIWAAYQRSRALGEMGDK